MPSEAPRQGVQAPSPLTPTGGPEDLLWCRPGRTPGGPPQPLRARRRYRNEPITPVNPALPQAWANLQVFSLARRRPLRFARPRARCGPALSSREILPIRRDPTHSIDEAVSRGGRWGVQETLEARCPLTRGCAVCAVSPCTSSRARGKVVQQTAQTSHTTVHTTRSRCYSKAGGPRHRTGNERHQPASLTDCPARASRPAVFPEGVLP